MNTSIHSLPRGLSLRANFSWTFVGNVVYAGCQWGMLVVLAKLGSPEMVGQFALGLASTAPIMMFANLSLRDVQATDARREYLFGDYLGLRLITTLLALLGIAGIVFVAGYRWETALVILTIGMAKAFEAISDVFYGLLQRHERMDRIAKSMMIKGPLSLASMAIGVYLTGSAFGGTICLVIIWALILVGYDIRIGALVQKPALRPDRTFPDEEAYQEPVLSPRWDTQTLSRLAWLALPLGVMMALVSLRTNIPRYLIEQYLGERELGIFAAIAYMIVAGNTVTHALGQSASPRLANYYAARNGMAFRTLLLKLLGVGAMLGATGILVAYIAGGEILTLLYGPEYAEHNLFVLLMVAAAVGYLATFLSYGMTAARHFKVQVPLFATVIGTLTLACLWLIPASGLRGAALALIIALSIQASGSLVIVGRALRTQHRHKMNEKDAK